MSVGRPVPHRSPRTAPGWYGSRRRTVGRARAPRRWRRPGRARSSSSERFAGCRSSPSWSSTASSWRPSRTSTSTAVRAITTPWSTVICRTEVASWCVEAKAGEALGPTVAQYAKAWHRLEKNMSTAAPTRLEKLLERYAGNYHVGDDRVGLIVTNSCRRSPERRPRRPPRAPTTRFCDPRVPHRPATNGQDGLPHGRLQPLHDDSL